MQVFTKIRGLFTPRGLFNKTKSLKVAGKLSLLLAVMLLGFTATGVTYFAVIKIEEKTEKLTREVSTFERKIEEVGHRILQSVSEEKSFLLDRQVDHVERFEREVSAVRETLGVLERSAPDDKLKSLLTSTNAVLSTYHAATYNMVETFLTFGLDENTGLYGSMRTAVNDIEGKLKTTIAAIVKERAGDRNRTAATSLSDQLAFEKLQISMLLLRRHEKAFLERKDKKYTTSFADEQENFLKLLEQTKLSADEKATLGALLATYRASFDKVVDVDFKLRANQKEAETAAAAILPILDTMLKHAEEVLKASFDSLEKRLRALTTVFFLVLAGTAGMVGVIGLFVSRSITRPMDQLHRTVLRVAEGDLVARARLERDDEIGALANAFDTLLDERLAQMAEAEREREERLAEAERENETLNNSVVNLLQAVARLSQRDLTVRAPVAEDVTGAVSDALNALAEETASVLTQVTRISNQVAMASRMVKTQSDAVVSLANQEREQVVQTSDELATAAEAMDTIATHARECNSAAEKAIQKTQIALETVTGTVEGINATRDIIRETEKRIKRLGERSQEISGVVNLINNIAERTHILALNASMHAASAGEAGRGFAVVADEVQRLAENARQATEQIATLVTNIQTETMDTVTTMNTAITQVVEGSRLAGQAGEQMQETQQTTADLVDAVQQIVEGLQVQARISNELRNRASLIVESTHQTSKELATQDEQTAQLLTFAGRLVDTVGVFTLPSLDGGPANKLGEVTQPAEGVSTNTEQAQAMARV